MSEDLRIKDVPYCIFCDSYFGDPGGACPLPALLYVCEIADDGAVLAGVELELPMDSVSLLPDRTLLKFLQGGYGFVIRDYGRGAERRPA